MKLLIPLLSFVLFLSACEGRFAGEREFNIEILNAPLTMRLVNLGGTDHLAVVNTNFLGDKSTGSLQFYSLASASSPSRLAAYDLAIPSNVSDFYYYSPSQRLFIADRNENELLVYDFNGSAFVQRTQNSAPLKYDLFDNPSSLEVFTDAQTSDPLLAVASFEDGTIQYLNIESETLVGEEELVDRFGNDIQAISQDRLYGSLFEMRAREEFSGRIQRISRGRANGGGIGKILFLGDDLQTFVAANFLAPALYGYRYSEFDNTSNLLWNLFAYEEGGSIDGEDREGTRESGFRGMVLDGSNNIFLSSRSDNGVYRITPAVMRRDRGSNRANTIAYDQNLTVGRLMPFGRDFDPNPNDFVFPRLGDIAVNNVNTGEKADRAWVLALENEDRGRRNSKLYLLDLSRMENSEFEILDEYRFPEGDEPQKLLYYSSANLLYAAATGGNKVYVFSGSSSINLVATIQNP